MQKFKFSKQPKVSEAVPIKQVVEPVPKTPDQSPRQSLATKAAKQSEPKTKVEQQQLTKSAPKFRVQEQFDKLPKYPLIPSLRPRLPSYDDRLAYLTIFETYYNHESDRSLKYFEKYPDYTWICERLTKITNSFLKEEKRIRLEYELGRRRIDIKDIEFKKWRFSYQMITQRLEKGLQLVKQCRNSKSICNEILDEYDSTNDLLVNRIDEYFDDMEHTDQMENDALEHHCSRVQERASDQCRRLDEEIEEYKRKIKAKEPPPVKLQKSVALWFI